MRKRNRLFSGRSGRIDLTEGSIFRGLLAFSLPLLLGQILQQMYNLADAWVVGNFADNAAFAAVSSAGNVTFLIIGFCNGLGVGGGVIISKYVGAKDEENVSRSIHTNVLMGLIASVVSTIIGLILAPFLMDWMSVPENVIPASLLYFRTYFGGVSTVILYNIFMSVMRALGDSIHPLCYLAVSSGLNVVLDLLLVAVFRLGAGGAAAATVFSQGVSALLCLLRMMSAKDHTRFEFRKIRLYPALMKDCLMQGLPTGIQGSVISIGNIVIQSNVNIFGEFAMSGHGAYSKIEGLAFLPITCMSMVLPTFVSQNLGAKKFDRARKGGIGGIIAGVLIAELIGLVIFLFPEPLLRVFISNDEAVRYGLRHCVIEPFFFCLLAFSHCAAGTLRGYSKAMVPMFAMLSSWCVIRIIYVTVVIHFVPNYDVICWAYPLTWSITTIVFILSLIRIMRDTHKL